MYHADTSSENLLDAAGNLIKFVESLANPDAQHLSVFSTIKKTFRGTVANESQARAVNIAPDLVTYRVSPNESFPILQVENKRTEAPWPPPPPQLPPAPPKRRTAFASVVQPRPHPPRTRSGGVRTVTAAASTPPVTEDPTLLDLTERLFKIISSKNPYRGLRLSDIVEDSRCPRVLLMKILHASFCTSYSMRSFFIADTVSIIFGLVLPLSTLPGAPAASDAETKTAILVSRRLPLTDPRVFLALVALLLGVPTAVLRDAVFEDGAELLLRELAAQGLRFPPDSPSSQRSAARSSATAAGGPSGHVAAGGMLRRAPARGASGGATRSGATDGAGSGAGARAPQSAPMDGAESGAEGCALRSAPNGSDGSGAAAGRSAPRTVPTDAAEPEHCRTLHSANRCDEEGRSFSEGSELSSLLSQTPFDERLQERPDSKFVLSSAGSRQRSRTKPRISPPLAPLAARLHTLRRCASLRVCTNEGTTYLLRRVVQSEHPDDGETPTASLPIEPGPTEVEILLAREPPITSARSSVSFGIAAPLGVEVALKEVEAEGADELLEEAGLYRALERAGVDGIAPAFVGLYTHQEVGDGSKEASSVLVTVRCGDSAEVQDDRWTKDHSLLAFDLLCSLHASGWLHGDFELRNILLDAGTDTVLLADFGRARPHPECGGLQRCGELRDAQLMLGV
ncbi:hypothetical protein JCM10449v2_001483 [Rhodotorula kratochvilovae]